MKKRKPAGEQKEGRKTEGTARHLEAEEGGVGKDRRLADLPPVIDPEKCSKCGLCSLYCPEGVISEDLKIDYDFCKGCGICANECPKKAIRMEREER